MTRLSDGGDAVLRALRFGGVSAWARLSVRERECVWCGRVGKVETGDRSTRTTHTLCACALFAGGPSQETRLLW